MNPPTELDRHAPLPVLDASNVQDDLVSLKTDVVVVGSGAGGATLAYELARAGKAVIMVEAGRYVRSKDFSEHLPDMFAKTYQDGGGQTNADGDIMIVQGRCVGGSTVVNGAVCFRTPEAALRDWRDEFGLVDMTTERLAPIFEALERRLGVHVNGAHEISGNSRVLLQGCEALGWSAHPVSRNVKDCALSGFCFHGCASDRKQSALVTHVPWAMAHGAKVLADTFVERVRFEGRRAVGITGQLRDPFTGELKARVRIDAERVVVAAGPIQTPLLLFRSEVKDQGGHLGRNLALHPSVLITADMEQEVMGHRGASVGACCDAFVEPGAGRFLFEGGMPSPEVLALHLPAHGEEHAETMLRYPHIAATACLIWDRNNGSISYDGKVKSIDYRLGDEEKARLRLGLAAGARIFLAAGARSVFLPTPTATRIRSPEEVGNVISALSLDPGTMQMISYHPQGTCRMGADPARSVVGPDGAVFGYEALYVADASLLPTAILLNPQMTVYMMAARVAARILGQ